MADPEDIPEVINPIFEPEPESDPEMDELDLDPQEGHAVEPLEEEELEQMISVEEHESVVDVTTEQAIQEVEVADQRAEAAEALLETEKATNTQLRTSLQDAVREKYEKQLQINRIVQGYHSSYEVLQKRVIRYLVEEGKTDYLIDRAIICHMIQDLHKDACK